MRNVIAATLAVALGASCAQAQQTARALGDPLPAGAASAPPRSTSSHDEFCRIAEETYRDIMNMPTKADKNVTGINFSIYRNESTHRILDLAIAAKCNITTFLMLEVSHARQTILQTQAAK